MTEIGSKRNRFVQDKQRIQLVLSVLWKKEIRVYCVTYVCFEIIIL